VIKSVRTVAANPRTGGVPNTPPRNVWPDKEKDSRVLLRPNTGLLGVLLN